MDNEYEQSTQNNRRPLAMVGASIVISAVVAVALGYPLQQWLLDVLPPIRGGHVAFFAMPFMFIAAFAASTFGIRMAERKRTMAQMQAALTDGSDGFASFSDLMDESEEHIVDVAAKETAEDGGAEEPLRVPSADDMASASRETPMAVPSMVRSERD